MPPMIPTVHLNGTSGERLLEQQKNAAEALRAALDALAQSSPNARDFYIQGPSAFGVADDAHGARMDRVLQVLQEVEAIAVEIHKQLAERKRR